MEQTPPPMDMPDDMNDGNMGGDFMPQGDIQQPPMDDMNGMNNDMGSEFDTTL